MTKKLIFKSAVGIMTALLMSACSGAGIEGKWVEPVPGMENQVQGIYLEKDGKASSINMATLQYEKWEKIGNQLILSGTSIGNAQTSSFTDTLIIEKISSDELTLKKGDLIINYRKQ